MQFMSMSFVRYPVGKSFKHAVSHVKDYGYIPRRQMIQNILQSGKSLDAFRSGKYFYSNSVLDSNGVPVESVVKEASAYYTDVLDASDRQFFLNGLRSALSDPVYNSSPSRSDSVRSYIDKLGELNAKKLGVPF